VYSTSVFTYIPRQIVVLLTGNSPRRFMPQYSKTLSIQKGVDNRIQFQFLNQEQKPISVIGKTITCRIINYDGTKILVTKTLEPDLPVTGIMSLYVGAADIENIPSQKAFYSLEIPVGSFDFPVYIDQNSNARGDIVIVDSILPSFVPSSIVTIPSGQSFPNTHSDVGNTTYTYYSSVVSTKENPILTLQMQFESYSGNVVIQGATNVDSGWYPITEESYTNFTDTEGYSIYGFHPFIRVEFTSDQGSVDNILVR